jgi:hypothetical protein
MFLALFPDASQFDFHLLAQDTAPAQVASAIAFLAVQVRHLVASALVHRVAARAAGVGSYVHASFDRHRTVEAVPLPRCGRPVPCLIVIVSAERQVSDARLARF